MSLFSTNTIKSSKGLTLYKKQKPKFDYFTEALNLLLENDINIDPIDFTTEDYRASISNSILNIINLLQNKLLKLTDNITMRSEYDYDKSPSVKMYKDFLSTYEGDLPLLSYPLYLYQNQSTKYYCLPWIISNLNRTINYLKDFIEYVNFHTSKDINIYIDSIEPGYREEIPEINIDYFRTEYVFINKESLEKFLSNYENHTNCITDIKTSTNYIMHSLTSISTDVATMPQISLKGISNSEICSKIVSIIDDNLIYIDNLLNFLLDYLVIYHQSCIERDTNNEKALDIIEQLMDSKRIKDNIIKNNQEENDEISREIQYEMYLAEKELIKMSNRLDYISESVGLIYLEEANVQVITNYISKIVRGINKVWRSLDQKVSDARQNLTKKLGKQLDNLTSKIDEIDNPGFTINNYRDYDLLKMDNLKVIPFNYEQMKNILGSEKDFISKSYSQITINEGDDFKTSVKKYLLSKTENHRVTTEDLHNYINYIREDFDNHRNMIKKDIETIDNADKAIIATAKSVNKTDTQTTNQNPTTINTSTTSTGESALLLEDDKVSAKMTYTDDPDREVKNPASSYDRQVSNYMSVSTQIISTKMQILREKYMISVNTLIHALLPPKKSNKTK